MSIFRRVLWQIDGEKVETVIDFIFFDSKITVDSDCNHKFKRHLLAPWKKSYDKPRQHIKRQRHYFADKGPYSQSYGFSSSHVHRWELNHKEDWAPRNWCFQTVVLEKTLESPLDSKEIKPVNPKGNKPWIFIGRTDACAEAPILWPPDEKSWLIIKDPDAGKDWGQEDKEVAEDEMVGWYHQLNGHEFEQTPGDSEGQRSLACCGSWSCKVRQDLGTEWQQWYVYLFVYVYVCAYEYSLCLCVHMVVYVHLYVYMSMYVYIRAYVMFMYVCEVCTCVGIWRCAWACTCCTCVYKGVLAHVCKLRNVTLVEESRSQEWGH